MTNVIRCDCGFVARESTAEEARRAAVIHINLFHPGFELKFSDVCWLLPEEGTVYGSEVPMGSGITKD